MNFLLRDMAYLKKKYIYYISKTRKKIVRNLEGKKALRNTNKINEKKSKK